jgi:predicted negative regulator of RcsB-dependent stress response
MNLTDFANIESLGPAALLGIAIIFVWRAWMSERTEHIATHQKLQDLIVAMVKSDEGVRALLQALLDEVRRNSK